MTRRIATSAILAALLLSGLLPSAVAADPVVPLPATMAAVGDSSTQAASTGGTLGADAPQNSWSTGTSGTVNSHYLRLLALSAPINGANHNRSVSGAKMAGLNAQMENVGGLQPDYLTVLIGGADLCTGTVAEMTSVTDFRAQFLTAMTTLTAGSPDTDVYLVSIPDAYQLWNLFKGDFLARFIWSAGNICQSLLANPTSTQAVDVQRRAAVRQRNIDYNTQLAEVCAVFASHCRFDNNAVFNTQFAEYPRRRDKGGSLWLGGESAGLRGSASSRPTTARRPTTPRTGHPVARPPPRVLRARTTFGPNDSTRLLRSPPQCPRPTGEGWSSATEGAYNRPVSGPPEVLVRLGERACPCLTCRAPCRRRSLASADGSGRRPCSSSSASCSPSPPSMVDAQFYANTTDDFFQGEFGLDWVADCGYSAMRRCGFR